MSEIELNGNKIDWKNLFKVRIANSDSSFQLHEIVKLILMMRLKEKHKKDSNWLRIYTEYPLNDNIKCDLFFENVKTKESYAYEIQKNYSKSWLENTKEKYSKIENPYFSLDLITINLNECPKEVQESIERLNIWLDKYII